MVFQLIHNECRSIDKRKRLEEEQARRDRERAEDARRARQQEAARRGSDGREKGDPETKETT